MTDRRPLLNNARRKHLKCLERRLAYLQDMVNEPNSPESHQWDQQEIAALGFAIRTIRNAHQPHTETVTP